MLVDSSPPYQLVPARTSSYQLVPAGQYCLPIQLPRSDIRLVPYWYAGTYQVRDFKHPYARAARRSMRAARGLANTRKYARGSFEHARDGRRRRGPRAAHVGRRCARRRRRRARRDRRRRRARGRRGRRGRTRGRGARETWDARARRCGDWDGRAR